MDQEQTEFLRAELCILDTASLGHGPVQVVTRPRAGNGGHAEAPWCDDKIDILVSLDMNWLLDSGFTRKLCCRGRKLVVGIRQMTKS